MPELAEVEYFRKEWDAGLGKKILAVEVAANRVLRGINLPLLRETLRGATLLGSEAHGKQMLFRFSRNAWLGLHLGMTGELIVAKNGAASRKHDRLALRQGGQSLVFNDPRQFGRILFDVSPSAPAWWRRLPPQILSPEFTPARVGDFLARHRRAPMKAALLMQAGFPGIGNWMADEILWQARVHPRRAAGSLKPAEIQKVFARTQSIARAALRVIGPGFGNPPKNWLFHRRWKRGGFCPRDHVALRHATIGGRTTCWCPNCQKETKPPKSKLKF